MTSAPEGQDAALRPDDHGLAVKLAWALHGDGDYEAAARQWAAIRERFPHLPIGVTGAAETLRRLGRHSEAEALLAQGMADFPDDGGIHVIHARLATDRRDWPEALRRWTDIRRLFPKDAAGVIGLGGALASAGQAHEADAVLEEGTKLFPDHQGVAVWFAHVADMRGDAAAACARWNAARLKFPDLLAAHKGEAENLRRLGRLQEALDVLQAAHRRWPEDRSVLASGAETVRSLGSHAAREAVDMFRAALDDSEVPYIEGLLKRGAAEAADQAACGLRDRRPDAFDGYRLGLEAKQRLGKAQERGDLMQEMLARFPQHEPALRLAALDATLKRDHGLAPQLWARYRDMFPNETIGYRTGAHALRDARQPEQADAVLLEGLTRLPDGPGILEDYIAHAERRRDWPEAARRWNMHRLRHNEAASYAGEAGALRKAGLLDEAATLVSQALDLFAHDPSVRSEAAALAAARRDAAALVVHRRALAAHLPHRADAAIAYAEALSLAGQHDAAEAEIRHVQASFPDDRAAHAEAARIAFRRAAWDEAVARWEAMQLRFADAGFVAHRLAEARRWSAEARVLSGEDAASPRRQDLQARAMLSLGERVVCGSVPMERLLTADWGTAQMEKAVVLSSQNPDLSPVHTLAEVQLDCMRGDYARARARIGETIDAHADKYPADTVLFRNLLLAAVLSSQWDVAKRLLSDRYGQEWCAELYVKEKGREEFSTVWEIDADGKSRFYFDRTIFRKSAWLERWVDSTDLFFAYTASPFKERGAVVFSSADYGTLPGLAPSDYRRENFLVPDAYFLRSAGFVQMRKDIAAARIPWNERKPVGLWRGSAYWPHGTVRMDQPLAQWLEMPRIKLCRIARDPHSAGCIDAALTGCLIPIREVVAEVERLGLNAGLMNQSEFATYKYQIDLDGTANAWSATFAKLLTGSPVLKVRSTPDFRQWYYDDLLPWTNFIPVEPGMGDLVEKINWLRAHDDVARRIGERGLDLAERLTYASEMNRAFATINAAMRYFGGRPEIVIPFGAGRPESRSLISGWSQPIDGPHGPGRFAFAPEARIGFPRPASAGDLDLVFTLAAARPGPVEPFRMVVLVNGMQVDDVTVTAPGPVTMRVAADYIARRTPTAMTLLFPCLDAVRTDMPSSPAATDLLFTCCHLQRTPQG